MRYYTCMEYFPKKHRNMHAYLHLVPPLPPPPPPPPLEHSGKESIVVVLLLYLTSPNFNFLRFVEA